MEGEVQRRLDGIFRLVRDPVIRKRAKHLWLFSVLIAICFGLITSAGLPGLTRGESGSASADRLWSSGAELNSTTADMEVTNTSGTISISSSTKRSGGYAYRTNPTSSTGTFYKTFANSGQSAKFWFREYIRIATAPGANTYVMQIGAGASGKISVRMTSSSTLQLRNEEDNVDIGSASSALSTNTWYRVELYVDTTTLSSTDATLLLDGVSVASSTAENLAAGVDRWTWGVVNSTTADLYFDDLAVNNSTGRAVDNWPGEGRIVHMHPDADGSNTAWTGYPSDTNDYDDVDEVTPNGDTDIIRSQTNNQIDDVNLESATNAGIGANDSIKLVSVGSRLEPCGTAPGGIACAAGDIDVNYQTRITAGGNTDSSASTGILDSSSYVTNDDDASRLNKLTNYDLPGTSTAPWTVSDLDSTQIGVKNLDAGGTGWRVTAIWLQVEYVDRSGGRLISSGLELNSTTAGMEFTASSGSPSINSTTFRTGAYALETENSGAQEYVRYYFESANTNNDYYARAYVRIATAFDASTATVLSFLDTSDLRRAYIKMTASRTLELWDEDGQIGSASSALSTNTWYRIELRMNTTPASGSHVVDGKIDGTSFASASNRSIGTGIARLGVGNNASGSLESSANTVGDLLWDDIAVNKAIGTSQNSWPGEGSIIHLRPNADDSTNTAWTNGFGNVDEVTPNDATDVVSETTSGDIDDYDLDASPIGSSDVVNLVSVGVRFRTSSATQEDFRVRVKDSATGIAIESNNISPASTTWTTNATADPKLYPLTAYTRPEQSTSWTDALLDNSQIGLRDVLSGTGTVEVTAAWLLVDYSPPATIAISGTCKQYDQTTDCTDDGANQFRVAVNGTLQAQVDTTVDGAWSITGVTQPLSGDVITVFIDGETTDNEEANAVAKYDGTGDISGIVLYYRHLTIGSADNQTLTNTNLSQYDNSVSSDEDIFFDVSAGNDLTVDSLGSYTDEELYTVTGNTFQPASAGGADVTTVDVENVGTWTADSNAITVAGSWVQSGTFTAGTSTVTMTSTSSGKTLSGTLTGSSAFYDLVFNGSGGAWSFSAAAETGRDFTITAGTVTAPSGNLTIARNFTNDATFTHNSGTVVLSTSTTATVSGAASATTFNNFTSTVAGKTIQFKKHTTGTPVFTFAGTFTITGAAGNLINLYSDTSGTQWKAHFNANQYSVSYVNLRDGGCDTGTSNVYMDAGSVSVSNNDTCWVFPINRLWSGGAELQSSTAEVETNFNDGTAQSISTTTKRSGAASWRVNTTSANAAFNKYFLNTPTQNKYWARVYIYIATTPSATHNIINLNGAAKRVGIRLNTSRQLQLWDEDGTPTQIGSNSSALSTSTWYRVEVYADTTTLATTSLELRVDGSSVASSSSVTLSGAFDRIQFGVMDTASTTDIYFDDIAINGPSSAANNWPGDGKIVHMHPNADGDNTTWTDSSANGTDYDDVDEVTPNDATDYLTSSTAGDLEDINLESSSSAGIGSSDAITLVSVGSRFRNCTSGPPCVTGGTDDTYKARIKASGGGTVEESAAITTDNGTNYNTNYNKNSSTANLYPLTLLDVPGSSAAKWTPTDLDSTQIGINHVSQVRGYRTSTTWLLVEYVPAVVVSGTIYSNEGSTVYNCSSDNLTIRLSLNGGANQTTTCTAAGGTYSITLSAPPAAASDPLIVFIDTAETPKATTATLVADTSSSITGFDLYQDRVIVRHEDAGPITNTKLSTGDNADAGIRYNVASGNITTDSGMKLLVWTGKTYTPGGTVTTTVGSSPSGDLGIQTSATLNMGGNALSVGGSYSNSGTFTSGSNTTTFAATSTGQTIAGTLTGSSAFYNLTFNGSGGGWSNSAAMTVTNDLTLTTGTLSGTNDVTVNGNVAGTAGAINFTGGTFEQRVAANKNFGTTSGSTAWTFSSLTFSNSHASTGFTVTTQTGGSGGITVSSILRIGKSGDASGAITTLDAGNRTWTLNGTGGDPFQILSSAPIGVLTANTSTFAYNGENASGNTTVQSATYYGLTVGRNTICSNDTYVLEAATTATNNLTITGCGTLDVVNGSNYALTLGGNYTNSGAFTARAGTVTFNSTATGKTLNGTMTSSSAFYNLTFDGVGGGWTFNAAVAATNDVQINNGAVTASNNNLTVTRDFILANTSGVGYTAGSSTMSVSRHFTDTGDKLTENTSTLTMAGTGTLTAATNEHFYTLSIAPSGGTTTVSANAMVVDNQLNFNGGTGTGSGSYFDVRCSSNCTPVVFNSASTLNGTQDIYFRANAGSITITIAGANFGSWGVIPYAAVGNSSTWQLGGNFTTTSLNGPRLEAETGITGSIFTTTGTNYSISSGSMIFAPCTPSRTGSWTVNLNASTVTLSTTGDSLTVGSNCGSHTLNMNSSSVTASGNVKFVNGTGTIAVNAGTSTLTFTPPTSSVKTYSPNAQSLYNVIINGASSTADIQPDAAVAITNDLTMTNGRLVGTQNVTVNGNVAGTAGAFNLTGGTFEQRVAASKNFGTTSGSTAWTFNDLTFSNSHASTGFTITTQTGGTGGITVTGIMRIGKSGDAAGATTTFDGGNRTWTLSGTGGDPFQILASPAGVLTPATSTFTYTGNNGAGNTNVERNPSGTGYYNLDINNASETFTPEGAISAGNDLTITAGTFDTTGTNYSLTITRDMTINGTFTANGSTITISRNWTFNTGATLNRGSSTVVMNGDGSILGSASTQFQNLSVAYPGKTTTFNGAGRTDSIGIFTVNGGTMTTGSASYYIFLISLSAGTFTPMVFASPTTMTGTTPTIVYRTIGSGITLNIAGGNYGSWYITPYSSAGGSDTWNLAGNVTTTGDFYAYAVSGLSNLTINTQNNNITAARLVLGGSSANASGFAMNFGSSTVTLSNGTSDAFYPANTTPTSSTHTLDFGSSSINVTGNVKFVNGSGAFTVTPGTSTLTMTPAASQTTTYTPNGQSLYNYVINGGNSAATVQPAGAVITTNNFTVTAGTYDTVSGSNYALTIGNNYSNSGTFTARSGTVTFNATDAGNTLGGTMTGTSAFYNLTFNGSGGDWTPSAAVAVTNDLAMTAGSLLGTQNVTVNGNATGAGTITLTGGTFEQRVASGKNFGTTSGSVAWSFVNLTFSNSSGSSATVTTQTGGSGGITVSTLLKVGTSGDTGATVLDAGNRTWTLSGTGGDPFQMLASPAAGFTGNSSTVTYTGNNGAGNTTVEQQASYYNLDINNSSESFVLEGNTTASNDLTVTNGSLGTTGSNYSLTASRDMIMSNTVGVALNANASTITVGRNWTDQGNKFGEGTTSLVVANGTGVIDEAGNFAGLSIAYSTKTTTFAQAVTINNGLTFNGGVATASVTVGHVVTCSGNCTPVTFASATTLDNSGGGVTTLNFQQNSSSSTLTVTGADYGAWDVNFRVNGNSLTNPVVQLGGNITTTGSYIIRTSATGTTTGATFNTQGYSITGTNLNIGTGSATNSWTVNFGASSITLSGGGTTGLVSNGGNHNWNLQTSTWSIAGHLSFFNTSSTITVNPGTSAITFTLSGTPKNLTSAGQSLYDVTINSAVSTRVLTLLDAMVVTHNLTITSGKLDTNSSGNYSVTIGGDFTNNSTFTANSSTVTLNGSAKQTLSGTLTGSSAFYDLTVTNSSGANASDCERTGFTPSIDFNAAATVTHNLTFTTASSRFEFNNGSAYTFTNINWNGQASGTKIYFRNSVAGSGSWSLNVSGTQTAVSYVNVSRSDASSGNTIGASNGTNTDCGNNVNWSFANPSTPANLAQKKTDNTVISTGGWTNETSVKFTADISDGDNPATIQLCIEKDLIATPFSNTEDSCGSTVSYTGTPVATSVTIGSLTDTAEYHWQARVKDSGGAYSAWVSYGGNLDNDPADRDFGVDTTACNPLGLVYDGTSTGVDSAYNDGSLTSLSANWGSFNCNVSGLNFYEYSIGTTSGGTQIKNWTNNSTTTAVTSTSLVLHTNQRYYVNVRATDNAGNLSSVSSSNGQDVLPQITFSLSGNTVTFSNLNDSNNRQDTKTTTLTTSTNAYGGYVVTQYAGGLLTSGSSTIPMFSAGSYASPAAWGTGFCSGSTCGFGYTSNDTTIQGSNKFSSGTLYAPYSQTAAGDIVADHTTAVDGSSGAVSNEQFIITHKVAVDALQPAKSYTGTIYYVVTGTF